MCSCLLVFWKLKRNCICYLTIISYGIKSYRIVPMFIKTMKQIFFISGSTLLIKFNAELAFFCINSLERYEYLVNHWSSIMMRSSVFALAGVHFLGKLQLVGDIGLPKNRCGPIRSRKCLVSICSFNCIINNKTN